MQRTPWCPVPDKGPARPSKTYILARWLKECRDPVEAFAHFRRIRTPRVHGVQRLSLSNMNFRHMKDTAKVKEAIDSGKGSVRGQVDWVWKYDVVNEWDKEPSVPSIYASEAAAV
jgi:salicylate hydroxylase